MTHDHSQTIGVGRTETLTEEEKGLWKNALIEGTLEYPDKKGAPKFLCMLTLPSGKKIFGTLEVDGKMIGYGSINLPTHANREVDRRLAKENQRLNVHNWEDLGHVKGSRHDGIYYSYASIGWNYYLTINSAAHRLRREEEYKSGEKAHMASLGVFLSTLKDEFNGLGWSIEPLSSSQLP